MYFAEKLGIEVFVSGSELGVWIMKEEVIHNDKFVNIIIV